MSRLHYFTVLLLIVLLAVASGWLFQSIDSNIIKQETVERHDPDYFLEQFSATMMDKKGQPSYTVKAEHLNHFPDDNSMLLKNAFFEFYENNKMTWTAQAQRVFILSKQDEIQLSKNIILQQVAQPGIQPAILKTSKMTIHPEKGQANTEADITLTRGSNRIDATGMRANLKTSRIEFLSNTRSHYVLPKK